MGLWMKLELNEFRVPEVQEQQTIRKEKQPQILSVFPVEKEDRRWQSKEPGLNFPVRYWLQQPNSGLNFIYYMDIQFSPCSFL